MSEIIDAIRVCLKGKIKCSYHKKDQRLSIISKFIRLHILPHDNGIIINRRIRKDGGYYIDFSDPESDPQKLIDMLTKFKSIDNEIINLLVTLNWRDGELKKNLINEPKNP